MTTKILSNRAISTIQEYLKFHLGSAVCSIPYYNNRSKRTRAALRAQIGKGSPQEIVDEIEHIATKQKINLQAIDSETFKKFLVDNNVGIDCSGLVYNILKPKLSFPFAKGALGIFRSIFRKVENADVATFAHPANSSEIEVREAQPGDIITMQGSSENERDHILLIHQVDYENEIPTLLYYTHSVAWPTDGHYGHGVRQGQISITNIDRPLTEQIWVENDKIGPENYTFSRAVSSMTSLRRLNVL
jgi:hypothetical protein